LAQLCYGQLPAQLVSQLATRKCPPLKPGTLFCSNESSALLCSDDGGAHWYDVEHFAGTYQRAWLMEGGSICGEITVPNTNPSYVPESGATPPTGLSTEKKAPETHPAHDVVLGVLINGKVANDFARLVEMGDGKLYASADLIRQWRLKVPAAGGVNYHGTVVYSLDRLDNGVKWQVNPAEQTLSFNIAPAAFTETVLNASSRQPVEADRPTPGLFLNHQLVFSHVDRDSGLAGLFETGFFSPLGVATSRFASRDFTNAMALIRLDTKLVHEFPHSMATLTLGDSISGVNAWSRQVTYGGIRWASDFSTQPAFVPVVLPNLVGQAAQPSTVDIFVNGVRTSQQTVDPGPFAINNVPVITGQGEVQMVVTDVLGRQQVITQPFISARQLLRPGVNEYTYEGGILRRNFGIVSSQYGSLFLEGQQRHGFTDKFTLDGRVEASGKQQTGGIGAEYALWPLGIIGGGVAGSRSNLGPGALAYLQLQRQARRLGLSGTVQVANSTFQQLGMAAGERAPKLQAQFQVTQALGRRSSFSVGYLRQQNRSFLNAVQPQRPDFSGITSSFSVRVTSRMYLTAAATLSNSFTNASSATMSLVVPLGGRTIASATSNIQQNGTQNSTMQYTQQVPVGTGYGYRLRTDVADQNRYDAGFTFQTNEGTLDLESSEINSQVSSRLTETGGLVMMHGDIIPSRWLNNSFAVVQVPDTSGVKVFANNQYIASTSWRGLAVVPTLAPYNKNTVRLDDQGVPIDLGLDLGEKTVVPRSRTGTFLKFKATPITGALFVLVTQKGDPVPSGAEVTLGGDGTVYTVALRGEVYIAEVTFPARLQVRWPGQSCVANVPSNPTGEPLPKIGPVTCEMGR
jgi:outer membrane usher protein